MPNFDRRTLFRIAGAAGAAAVAAGASASVPEKPARGARGVLVDTTLCVGCRSCEAACSEANGTAPPERPDDDAVFATVRTTGPETFTVVNRASVKSPSGEDRYAKRQCMHCVEPACATACAVNALEKTLEGPVVYDPSKCMGCRYCMVACPFSIPKYQFAKAVPLVRKCQFCAERQAKGLEPACTSACPSGALTFGYRAELLETAKKKVWGSPDRYVHHVWGENEAGGTSWLYISDIPFEEFAMRTNVPKEPYIGLTEGALSTVPFVLTLWPPLLMGLSLFTKRTGDVATAEEKAREEERHG